MNIFTVMTRIGAIRLAIPTLALLLLAAAACGGGGDGGGEENPFNVKSELVANAAQADSMQFAPDGRLFYIEHWTGNVRIIDANGTLLPDPFAHVDLVADIQIGATGLALDPDFATNHFVYVLYTKLLNMGPPLVARPEVIRFTDQDNVGAAPTPLIDDLPEISERPYDINGHIQFGPDGFLYLTLGDYDIPADKGPHGDPLAQDVGSPIGKVLRVNRDGSPAPGNPFAGDPSADPRIFATGFHLAFDFTFQPPSGPMYGSDSTGVTCEEINVVESGKNYGWPEAGEWPFNNCEAANKTPAVFRLARPDMRPEDFDSTVAVRGMQFISGSMYPTLGDSLIVCESRTDFMRRVTLGGAGVQPAVSEPIVKDCHSDITTAPDGTVYYSNLSEIRRLVQGPSPTPE